MERTKIVFLDRETLSPETVLRRPEFAADLREYQRTAPDEVAARIKATAFSFAPPSGR